MENLIILLSASLLLYKAKKKFKTLLIPGTTCSVQFFPVNLIFDSTSTEEGDTMLYAEHHDGASTYGIICARLHEELHLEDAHRVLINYMNRLRKPFDALFNVGIVNGEENLFDNEKIQLEDYWQDSNGLDWKVKGYTNGKIITVLYVKNINAGAVEKQDIFLDSFVYE